MNTMTEENITSTQNEDLTNSVEDTVNLYSSFEPLSSVFDSVDISDVVEDFPQDLYLECEDDGPYDVETTEKIPLHSLIGQNVQLKISFPPPQLYGIRKEDPLKAYKCLLCRNTFKTEISFMKHMKCDHAVVKPYACSMCKYQSANKRLLTCHYKRAHSVKSCKNVSKKCFEQITKIPVMDQWTASATNTSQENEEISQYGGTTTNTCSGSNDCEHFKENIEEAGSKSLYLCPQCAAMFSDEHLLDKHCDTKHKASSESTLSELQPVLCANEPKEQVESLASGDIMQDISIERNIETVVDDSRHLGSVTESKRNLDNNELMETKSNVDLNHLISANFSSSDSKTPSIISDLCSEKTVKAYCDISFNTGAGVCPLLVQDVNSRTCTGGSPEAGDNIKEVKLSLPVSPPEHSLINKSDQSERLCETSTKNRTEEIQSFSCNECVFICKQKRTFLIHLKKHERSPEKKKCLHCDKCFLSGAALKRHVKTHNNERPYPCSIENCKARFKAKGALTDHLHYVHKTGVICDERKNISVNKPSFVKGKSKNFVCSWPNCDKSFRDNYNLALHYKCHTGEKGFQCLKCDYACIQKSSLDRHLKKHP